jgi:hypothetical protein
MFVVDCCDDLSRTWDSTATLIYNSLVMFMFHSWIKIKLKVKQICHFLCEFQYIFHIRMHVLQ